MKANINMENIVDKYNKMATRERMLIIITVVSFIYFIWNLSLGNIIGEQTAELHRQQTILEDKQWENSLNDEFKDIHQGFNLTHTKSQIDELKNELSLVDESISEFLKTTVDANEMGEIIQHIITANAKGVIETIELASIEMVNLSDILIETGDQDSTSDISEITIPGLNTLTPSSEAVKTISAIDVIQNANSLNAMGAKQEEEDKSVKIYKHHIRLLLQARYIDIVNYLEAIENLPWPLIVDSLKYEVTNAPNAQVELNLYTLSLDRGFFGA